MASIRLDKLLADRTPHSRSEVKQLLRRGAVQVDGICEKDGTRHIDPDAVTVTCEGRPLASGAHVCCIVNKPQGYICATEDKRHPVVTSLVPEALRVRGLFPAGRLDSDSTGMVFLTDDGDLAHRMLSPRHHVPKFYLIGLARPWEDSYAEQLAAGMTLADGTVCLPAEAMPLPVEGQYALICLREGRYHQVKRMLAALGNHVSSLHRVGIGGLILPPDLPSGGCLEVLHNDVETLLKRQSIGVVSGLIVTNFSSYLINAGR